MQSMALWPFLALMAAGLAFVPTIEDSGYRSLVYWLVIPPLVVGMLVASSHLGVS
jgi:hypothetical protein